MARPAPTPISVTEVREVGLRTIRIAFSGYPFGSAPLPAAYFEIWFEPPPEWPPRRGGPRSPKRTFTPFRIVAEHDECVVDFVLHGEGVATDWARSAGVGSVVHAGPLKGGYSLPETDHLVVVGDATAIPAIETIVAEAADIDVTGIIEVIDADDERADWPTTTFDPVWTHRGADPAIAGCPTADLLSTLELPGNAAYWIAGERESIRTMRDIVVARFGTSRENISLNAHWRLRPVDPRTAHA